MQKNVVGEKALFTLVSLASSGINDTAFETLQF
jgi:hypothetical protein